MARLRCFCQRLVMLALVVPFDRSATWDTLYALSTIRKLSYHRLAMNMIVLMEMEENMKIIRYRVIVLLMLLCLATSASAQVSIGIGLPNLRIGINLPLFPELEPVPGYPVYYAPRVDTNYFFYDGMYWVYQDDNWYASYWYNGPWSFVEPTVVPLVILRFPVRYYQHAPAHFRGWRPDAPPRWGKHWGRDWEQRRRGWDRWRRDSAPARAPLPAYQRQYSGDRYPRVEQQHALHREHYRYQPRDKAVRQHFQQQGEQRAPEPVQRERQDEPRIREQRQQDIQRQVPPQAAPHQREPAFQEQKPHGEQRVPDPVRREKQEEPRIKEHKQQDNQRQTPPQQREPVYREQRPQPEAVQQERQEPRPHSQEQRFEDKGRSQEPRGQGEDRGRERHN